MSIQYRKAFIESLLSSDDGIMVKAFWKLNNAKNAIFNTTSAIGLRTNFTVFYHFLQNTCVNYEISVIHPFRYSPGSGSQH